MKLELFFPRPYSLGINFHSGFFSFVEKSILSQTMCTMAKMATGFSHAFIYREDN